MKRAFPVAADRLHAALKAEGYQLPEECAEVSLGMPIDGVFQLHYTVNLVDEHLAMLGRALVRLAEPPVTAFTPGPFGPEKR